MGQPIVQVDAFTDRPFAGNPAAVCILRQPRDEAWMQAVAREMNLSETAFLLREGDGFRLRWFTPATEVDLCGHATLAAAHVLWEDGHLKPGEQARFFTRSGLLTAWPAGGWIEMDFPLDPPKQAGAPPGLGAALGADPKYVGKARIGYLVEVESEKAVRGIEPDFGALLRLDAPVGILVTSRSATEAYDFVSRFFAPAAGIYEDPVTGAAHCALGPFWAERLEKAELVGYQASARGGVVRVKVAGKRAILGGQAVTVLRGELLKLEARR